MSEIINAERTGDAGQELAFNKRNRVRRGLVWSDIADKEAALRVSEVVKQKVVPRPDYQALVDEGVSPFVVYVVKLAYDALSAKPQTRGAPTDEQLQLYIEEMGRYMDGVISWARDRTEGLAWISSMRKRVEVRMRVMDGLPTPVLDLAQSNPKGLYEWVYPGGWSEREAALRLIGGQDALSALQPGIKEISKAMKEIEIGWPAASEAWQKRGLRIVATGDVRAVAEDVLMDGEPAKWVSVMMGEVGSATRTITFIDRLFNQSDLEQQAGWTEAEVARFTQKYVLLNKLGRVEAVGATQEEVLEVARGLARKKSSEVVSERGISVDEANRLGPVRREQGRDISSEELMQEFGFRGVNFGNWMKGDSNQAERQLHLNHAFDAFHDLAQLLGIPPKAISMNGMLGLAFGAQGNGKAAAHFVPGLNEMNITRTAGAGTIAHEWAHALDHRFACAAGLDRHEDPYLSAHAYRSDQRNQAVAAVVKTMTGRLMTPDEKEVYQRAVIDRLDKNVASWVRGMRRDFESASKGDAEFLDQFSALEARVFRHDYGQGHVKAGSAYLSPVLIEMRSLYKIKTGYSYQLDAMKSLQANINGLVRKKEGAAANVASEVWTDTTYAKNAAALDHEKGGKPYWATVYEMFARAFDAYIQDAVARQGWENTYLCGLNADDRTVPAGEERIALTKAFDHLVSMIEARPTESGVELCCLEPKAPQPCEFERLRA